MPAAIRRIDSDPWIAAKPQGCDFLWADDGLGTGCRSEAALLPGKDALTLRSVAACRRMRSLEAPLKLWQALARSSYQTGTLRRTVASMRIRHERRPRKTRSSRFPLEILPGRQIQIPDLFVG
jgi:hypothetical protein